MGAGGRKTTNPGKGHAFFPPGTLAGSKIRVFGFPHDAQRVATRLAGREHFMGSLLFFCSVRLPRFPFA